MPYAELWLVNGSPSTVADWIARRAGESGPSTLLAHINANNFYWLFQESEIRARVLQHWALLLDGIALRFGGLLLGHSHLVDLNGTDLFPMVMDRARRAGLSVYLLGSKQHAVERARQNLEARFPGLRVVGCRCGYFEAGDESRIVNAIRDSRADILLVGLGFMREMTFVLRHRDAFDVPLIWSVGGLFDFLSNEKPRAPLLMRKCGLEWLYRFYLEPRAMWHRNAVAAPWFLWHVVRAKWAAIREPRNVQHRPPSWLNDIVGERRPELQREH